MYRSLALSLVSVVSLLAKLLLLGAALDNSSFPSQRASLGATAAMVLLASIPAVWCAPGRRVLVLLTINVLGTTLALADVIHFRYYGDVLSFAEFAHAHQLLVVGSSILGLAQSWHVLLYADVLILGLLARLWRDRRRTGVRRSMRLAVSVGLITAALALSIAPMRLVWTDPEEVFEYATTRREVAVAIGLLPHHLYDAGIHVMYPLAGRLGVDAEDRDRVRRFLRAQDRPPYAGATLSGVARGRNLIIVMAESLQSFPLDLTIDGQEVAPELSRFATESLRFENFYDQTYLGTTSDGEFTSLQSLHPLPVGAVSTRYASNDYHGLPAILSEAGYATVSASGEPGDFWNKRQMHPKLGFERSYFAASYQQTETFGMGLSDGEFFRQTIPILRERPEPFMAFLMTLSNHHPYVIPARHRTLRLGQLEGTLLGNYLHSVHYFDSVFGQLIESLNQSGLLDRSVVAVYGDHQGFWEHVPGLARLLGYEESDEVRSWEARTRLPFLIRLPDGQHARTQSIPAGHLDVAPTLLDLLGVSDPSSVMLGRALTQTGSSAGVVVFRDGSFTDQTARVIRHRANGGSKGCYVMPMGTPTDCAVLAARERAARERLEVSDLIITGNLIGELRASFQRDRQPGSSGSELVVIAHRGNSIAAPENTLAAIASAFDVGSHVVEVDVRLSRDGVPVIIHDETVDRTTNGTGAVADKTLEELRSLDAGSWMGAEFAGETIPTLTEALLAARGRVRLLLDVPVPGLGGAIADAFSEVALPVRGTLFGSWDDEQRKEFRRHLPDADLLLSEGAPARWDASYFAERTRQGVTTFEIANWSPEFLASAHAHGFPVWVYTVND